MSEVQVRFPSDLADELRVELTRQIRGREPVVFALASSASTVRSDLVLIRELIVPPFEAFLPSAGHGARWSGAYTIEVLNRALERQCGVFICHSHGDVDEVEMSSDDRQSALMLLPKFQRIISTRPHGSLVFGRDCVAGIIFMPGTVHPTNDFSCRVLGGTIATLPRRGTHEQKLLLARQPVTANPALDHILAATTVAVVGLSGGGSQVVPQLAALGIGRIIGVDPQRISPSNRYATSRIGRLDILLRRRKSNAMARVVRSINRKVHFVRIDSSIGEAAAIAAIKSADIVVGCVNNLHARSDLMELCWRYCIPYIDIGLGLQVDRLWATSGPPPLTGIHGNVFVAVPGGPCMWCTEFLTQAKLDAETGGRGRSYLRDQNDSDAWVLSFNGVLASQAVGEVLQLLAGYASGKFARAYKVFDGMSGALTECIVKRKISCTFCRSTLNAGDVIWS